jgi:small GTP-binding protein
MTSEIQAVPIKVITVGSINVGKTSLVAKYATGKTPGKTKSTKNASFVNKMKKVNGINFEIKLWDTAGQEKYKCLTKLFTKDAKIAILVYAIDNEESFNELDKWYDLVKSTNEETVLYAVAANKSDLASQNTIPDERGKEYAKKINAEFKSTSAKDNSDGINSYIDELFLKYFNSNFNMNTSGSLSITLSTENNSIVQQKGCCGGGKSNKSSNNTNKNKKTLVKEQINEKQ